MSRLLLFGCEGQVGRALAALEWAGHEVRAFSRTAADIATERAAGLIEQVRPAVVINAAAYTSVEGAERAPDAAHAVNAQAVAQLAAACARVGAWLVHYSTDYVFDGEKAAPYVEGDTPHPLNAYGESKLAGEQAIAQSGCRHLILRTSWVYSREGENFINKILARARAGAALSVVNDQFGAPTWAHALALATQAALGTINERGSGAAALCGLYHLTAAGRCSWHTLAEEVLRLQKLAVPVRAVSAAQFASAARRPGNSCLDSTKFAAAFGYRIGDWREDVARCFGS